MRMTARALLTAAALVAAPLSAVADPEFWKFEWPKTDFSRTSIGNWTEIMSGGPPRDGIPAILDPAFIPVSEERRLDPREAVIALEMPGERPRAYPIRYLMWHEIVNDEVGGIPVAVTYCPLCNSALVFDRRAAGRTLTFGVTGKLRNSDMVMYDHQTESWWQQALGEAIVGELTGTRLAHLPGWMESWGDFGARNPDGLVMDQPRFARSYGQNPYMGYDSAFRPFLYNGEMPPHGIPPLMRVVRVGDMAWPLSRFAETHVIREAGYVLNWKPGQASPLDTGQVATGRDIGSIRVRDESGADVPHDVMFAFAFHAFWPEGRWMLGE